MVSFINCIYFNIIYFITNCGSIILIWHMFYDIYCRFKIYLNEYTYIMVKVFKEFPSFSDRHAVCIADY